MLKKIIMDSILSFFSAPYGSTRSHLYIVFFLFSVKVNTFRTIKCALKVLLYSPSDDRKVDTNDILKRSLLHNIIYVSAENHETFTISRKLFERHLKFDFRPILFTSRVNIINIYISRERYISRRKL